MSRLFWPLCRLVLALTICGAQPVRAQEPAPRGGPPVSIDPSSVPLPNLAFQPSPEDAGNYDKYFYFHRAETDFATAYADIQECDGYARGFTFVATGGGYHGVVGNLLADALADAVHGSAERRRLRRVNMRTCMSYQGYTAFGLPKTLWEAFNFEEGNVQISEERRRQLLQVQARVASGPRPQTGEMPQ